MKRIPINNSCNQLLVDDNDYERLYKHNWSCNGTSVLAYINGNVVNIGRFLLNLTDPNIEVDHKDRNIFNNQKENLRQATKSQNQANKNIRNDNISGYIGVDWRSDARKWRAQIRINKVKRHLGLFTDVKLAARAYNNAALEHFGEFAVLNDIQE